MPNRFFLPGPSADEECRQLAEAVADLHYVMATVVEARGELIPGEAVDELTVAWEASESSMRQLAVNLVPDWYRFPIPPDPPPNRIPHAVLAERDLTGPVGQAKRSALQRFRDVFLMFWHSLPRTEEKKAKAAEAAGDYFDLGATVIGSIPGYEKAVELLSLIKQLVGFRAKRGV